MRRLQPPVPAPTSRRPVPTSHLLERPSLTKRRRCCRRRQALTASSNRRPAARTSGDRRLLCSAPSAHAQELCFAPSTHASFAPIPAPGSSGTPGILQLIEKLL